MATSIQEVTIGGVNPDCQNWFQYTSNGNYSFNFFGEAVPPVQTTYVWDFGDGTLGYGQEISHVFEPSGVEYFNVCLTTYSNISAFDTCVSVSCQQVYIGGSGGDCINAFTYESWNNIDFAFIGESVPQTNEYFWNFGDGSYGRGQTALHSYGPNSGEYVTVILITYALDPATGDSCVATSAQEIWLNGSGTTVKTGSGTNKPILIPLTSLVRLFQCRPTCISGILGMDKQVMDKRYPTLLIPTQAMFF